MAIGISLGELDKKLVNLLQSGLPLVAEPYAEIARRLGTSEADVIGRVARLKDERLTRIIGPVFNSRTLGYESTLVAMKVPEERLEEVAGVVNRHPGVSHNYQRNNAINLWFTLTVTGSANLDEEIGQLAEQTRPEVIFQLPSVKLFKIKLYFDLLGSGNDHAPAKAAELELTPAALTPIERRVINKVQETLPVVSRPFDVMAIKAGTDTDQFVACLRSLMARGIIRRFGATIDQTMAGFTSSVMVCWAVPGIKTEEAGQKMAAFKEVTHCYERKSNPYWPYNVYTMLHSRTAEHLDKTVADIATETGLTNPIALATIRCFKKQRVKFRV